VTLTHATATCLPCTASTTVRALALSPSGGHLLMFDEDGRALLVNFRRRVVLHHLRFKAPVLQCRFSPDGRFFACVTGKYVQVRRPAPQRTAGQT
jgi:periodic tryptophan protein 2